MISRKMAALTEEAVMATPAQSIGTLLCLGKKEILMGVQEEGERERSRTG